MLFKKISGIRRVWRASRLGADYREQLKFLLLSFWLPIKYFFNLSTNTTISFRLQAFDQNFTFYVTNISDLWVLKEVFVDREYDIQLLEEPETIFDLGSNVGVTVLYFRLKYPSAKIFAFEPDPDSFRKLSHNTKQFKNIFLFKNAVSDESAVKNFYSVPGGNIGSSLVRRLSYQKTLKVRTLAIDSVLDEYSLQTIDFLKFDIEGAEMEVFRGMKNIEQLGVFLGELHIDLINGTKEEFMDLFRNKFKLQEKKLSRNRSIISGRKILS